jgi:hypothetical protein
VNCSRDPAIGAVGSWIAASRADFESRIEASYNNTKARTATRVAKILRQMERAMITVCPR